MGKRKLLAESDASLAKRVRAFREYSGAPLPSGLAAAQELPVLQMSMAHEKVLNDVKFDEPQEIVTQIHDVFNYNLNPVGAIVHGAPIHFTFRSGTEQYIDFHNSTLCIECKITNPDGSNIPAGARVAPVNNTLHSLFSNIEVLLSNRRITQPQTHYPYVAALSQMTSYESDVLKKLKETEGWHADTQGLMNTFTNANEGWEQRRARFALSRVVPLEGRPFVPIFIQRKFVMGNLPLQINLYPSRDAFVLTDGGAQPADRREYKMQITKAYFRLSIKKMSATTIARHIKERERQPMRIMYTDVWPKSNVISQGASHFTIPNIFDGTLPDRITLCLLNSEHVNGTYTTNPLNLQHMNMQSVQIEVNGSLTPAQAIETNFTAGEENTTFAYLEQMRALGVAFSNSAPAVDRAMWANGYTFYTFQVLPAPEDLDDAKAPTRQGTITIKGIFRVPTPHTVTAIVIGEFYGRFIEIDAYNQVTA
jgi:hypothetical protein